MRLHTPAATRARACRTPPRPPTADPPGDRHGLTHPLPYLHRPHRSGGPHRHRPKVPPGRRAGSRGPGGGQRAEARATHGERLDPRSPGEPREGVQRATRPRRGAAGRGRPAERVGALRPVPGEPRRHRGRVSRLGASPAAGKRRRRRRGQARPGSRRGRPGRRGWGRGPVRRLREPRAPPRPHPPPAGEPLAGARGAIRLSRMTSPRSARPPRPIGGALSEGAPRGGARASQREAYTAAARRRPALPGAAHGGREKGPLEVKMAARV